MLYFTMIAQTLATNLHIENNELVAMVKYWKVQKYQLSYCILQFYTIIEPKKHKFQVSEYVMNIKKIA